MIVVITPYRLENMHYERYNFQKSEVYEIVLSECGIDLENFYSKKEVHYLLLSKLKDLGDDVQAVFFNCNRFNYISIYNYYRLMLPQLSSIEIFFHNAFKRLDYRILNLVVSFTIAARNELQLALYSLRFRKNLTILVDNRFRALVLNKLIKVKNKND